MTTVGVVGTSAGSKIINLSQLQAELAAAGVDVSTGLGQTGEHVFTYATVDDPLADVAEAVDFPSASQAIVESVIANHVAMRDKSDAELSAEFQATSDPARKQDIRDMQSGLLEREQVPM